MVRGCFIAISLLIFLSPLGAQGLSGTISGLTKDASGGVVSGASVQIVNANTNVRAWTGSTSREGTFVAPMLNAGAYNVSIEAPGFKKFQILGLPLEVDQRARVDAVLQPGELKQTITVTGDTVALLNKEDSAHGLDVSPSELRDVPLASRDIFNLMNLAAGVSAGGDATAINDVQFSVNGSRTEASEVTVDGGSVISGSSSMLHIPSTEAIREVKILTATYSAEYGRTSGATIAAMIDSGTNLYHGGLYEYFRNEDLDANNFFNNLRGLPRQPDRQNQFGAKLSGPVWLPKLYRGKNRTFFFVNYEGIRPVTPAAHISTLPPAQFSTGNFSSSPVVVADPLTNPRTPFAGNQIPASRLSPAAQKILGVLPVPNSPGTFDPTTGLSANNYVDESSTKGSSDDLTWRVDHSLSDATRLFAKLTSYRNANPTPAIVAGLLNPGSPGTHSEDFNAALGLTASLTPSLIFDVRANILRDTSNRAVSAAMNVPGVLGIQNALYDTAPVLSITGFTTVGSSSSPQFQANTTVQYSPSLTWVKGKHTLKVGAELRRLDYNIFSAAAYFGGDYTFTGDATSPSKVAGNPVNALADFLLGDIKTARGALSQPMSGHRGYNMAFFVQDDWKITSKLTLNLGLREEYESPMTTSNNMYSRIDLDTGQLLVAGGPGKNSSPSLGLNPPKMNLGPRIGFAYALGPKTVIRSAFGAFYWQLFSILGGVVTYPGYTLTEIYNSVGSGTPQPFTLNQGMPITMVPNYSDPGAVVRTATVSSPYGPSTQYDDTHHLPENLQWNFGIQQEISRGTMLDVSYVGSHAYDLPLYILQNSINSFQIANAIAEAGTSVATQAVRPFPWLTSWNSISLVGSSKYDSLQVRFVREMSRSLSFIANYTFAKALDDGTGSLGNTQPAGFVSEGQLPQLARNLEHGPSAFDRRNTFTIVPRYTLNQGPRWVRDISFSAVISARSGLPESIYQNGLFPDAVQQRPNIVGTASQLYEPHLLNAGTAIQYLRPTTDPAFPLYPTGPLFATVNGKSTMILPATIGNLGPMIIRSPGDVNFNLAAGKRIRLRERLTLQLRAEAFNAFNHTNLLFPSSVLNVVAIPGTATAGFNSPGYGLITTARAARFMQLVARIEF